MSEQSSSWEISGVVSAATVLNRHARLTHSPQNVQVARTNVGHIIAPYHSGYALAARIADGRALHAVGAACYNPVDEQWHFPGELVEPDEQAALRAYIEDRVYPYSRVNMLNPRIRAGRRVVDAQHPTTLRVRKRLGEIMQQLGPESFFSYDEADSSLSGDASDVELIADDFTLRHPALDFTTAEPGADGPRGLITLSMVYAGILIVDTLAGFPYTCRQDMRVPIAHQDRQNPGAWQFEAELSQDEWEVLDQAVQVLTEAADEDPRFDPSVAMIAHGPDRGWYGELS